jgi:hypothetical protein
MRFEFDPDFELDDNSGTPFCDSNTTWEVGRFEDGRYKHDQCRLLDMNPREMVHRFPNKFVFLDGDSHQQDLFWGMVNEVGVVCFFTCPVVRVGLGI